MWHASASNYGGGRKLLRNQLRAAALSALNGVGDRRLGQWEEMSEVAYHVKRRLSDAEALLVGPVVDIRGTPEAAERIAKLMKKTPWLPLDILRAEAKI